MLTPGHTVGHYTIDALIGQGGMGQVYRATDPRLERTVALKVISTARLRLEPDRDAAEQQAAEFSARLLREARAVASLNHPNVVNVFDVGEQDGVLYLAMEYVTGPTLRALVGKQDIPWPRRVRWLVDIARALGAAHKAGVVHRDVKPENVIVRDDGVVKVLDFGIARRTVAPGGEPSRSDTVTGQGSVSGTPVYMSPEQLKAAKLDARTDQFSWGVVAYELLAGERPWPNNVDSFVLVAAILTEAPPPLRERAKDVPVVVEETISRALSKDPQQRFGSMEQIADAIEPFASVSTGSSDRLQRVHEPVAYAETTRVPTTLSSPTPAPKNSGDHWRARAKKLWLPVALLALLGTGVVAARRAKPAPVPIVAPRPISTVEAANTAYEEASQLWHDGAMSRAERAFERAIELDPTLAAAHLEVAVQTFASDTAEAQGHFQNAFEHRALLSRRDTAFLEASEPYIRAAPDLVEWETRLTRAALLFPRDAEFQFYLGKSREKQLDYARAKEAYARSVAIDASFIPGWWALAGAEKLLGNTDAALNACETCLTQSPVAAICVEFRYRLRSDTGDCRHAREDAAMWMTIDRGSPAAAYAFGAALLAQGAPRPSVEETLSRRWTQLPESERRQAEVSDHLDLALVEGQFDRAVELTRELERLLPPTSDALDHAGPAMQLAQIDLETGRLDAAGKAAKDYLQRMAAWPAYPLGSDPSIGFFEPLYRAGEITKAELVEKRARWLATEEARTDKQRDRSATSAWASAFASFAETPEEAKEALEALPRYLPLPIAARRPIWFDFAVGKTYALAGRPDDAIPLLQRVVDACVALPEPQLHTRAHYFLGMAQESKGNVAAARQAYRVVIDRWGSADPRSTTAEKAKERLRVIARK